MKAFINKPVGGLKILVLYDDWTAQTAAVYDQMEAFSLHSENQIAYAIGTLEGAALLDASKAKRLAEGFDVIVVHHSVRLCVTFYLNPAWAETLASFSGYKVLFLQDDYERTETTRRWIEKLGFNALFTIVPEDSFEKVYPRSRFPNMEIQNVLTGYVPRWAKLRQPVKPIAERSRLIGYRAFKLPFYFGDLAREKFVIGQRMREICESKGIPVDIEWDPEKRIYGSGWFDFIEDCRATLGTESGSNVFDEHGEVERQISEALKINPDLSYEEAHRRFMSDLEGKIVVNQISPRIFESIALGSALILFEGEYSGVVRPHEHFIPLKKDFSNVDEVLEKLRDTDALQEMTQRAYLDVIESDRYSYEAFVARFDAFLRERVTPGRGNGKELWISAGAPSPLDGGQKLMHQDRQLWMTSLPFSSSENCKEFFSTHGPESLVRRLKDVEAALTQSGVDLMGSEEALRQSQAEVAQGGEYSAFIESEAARFQAKSLKLIEERRVAGENLEIMKRASEILTVLAGSRTVAWLRALGLCGAPPKLQWGKPEKCFKDVVEYVEGNRWLRRIAVRNSRIKTAMKPPEK